MSETPAEEPRVTASEPAKKKKNDGLVHYVGIALSVALLGAVILAALVLIVVPKVAGATPLTVLTGSMKPGLPPGTLIVVQPVNPDDVRVGDVITYQIRSGEPDVITHRVIAIDSTDTGELSFILQGDNNADADEPVKPLQIQGRLWYSVPYVGFVNNAVNGESRSWIVPVIAGLLFTYAAYMIIGGLISNRRKSKRGRRKAELPQ